VTGGRENMTGPASGESGKLKDGESLQSWELMADLRLKIVEVKK
jgi:hypothetical protein